MTGEAHVEALTVFVRGVRVHAEVGVHAHEIGRTQPLLIDAWLEIAPRSVTRIGETVNYELVVAAAADAASRGHFPLVEAFAEAVARTCLADARVRAVRIRVEKPEALAPAAAGVELTVRRA